jgi:erythronate-4-phosphate dehydrogenase
MKIVADIRIPFLREGVETVGELTLVEAGEIEPPAVDDADVLFVRTRTRCDENLLKNSKVKFIGSATIGFDHIDTQWCESRGIQWTNAPGCNSDSVVQYIASAFAWLHHHSGFDPDGLTIGIVGVGQVGSRVASLARMLGMEVLLCDPPREEAGDDEKFVSLAEIAEKADVVTLHTPLTTQGGHPTHHLINASWFDTASKAQLFINTSRGEVVDTIALRNWLSNNPSVMSVIDVWENEPEPDLQLMQLVTIATPHVAGYSLDGKANGTAQVVNAMKSHFKKGSSSRWYPTQLPQPEQPLLYIDCDDLTDNEVCFRAFLHSYDISRDDFHLRHDPSSFENYRSEYPLRREWNAFTLRLRDSDSALRSRLKKLGFVLKKI